MFWQKTQRRLQPLKKIVPEPLRPREAVLLAEVGKWGTGGRFAAPPLLFAPLSLARTGAGQDRLKMGRRLRGRGRPSVGFSLKVGGPNPGFFGVYSQMPTPKGVGRGEFEPLAAQPGDAPQVEELATVVVCEDDDPTRELLCDHLTADRYRALPAPSASDALRLCGYNHPDLMLLDLGPDAPGIDVLREIRALMVQRVRPRASRDGPLREDERGRPAPRLRGRRGRLPPKAIPLSGAGGPGAAVLRRRSKVGARARFGSGRLERGPGTRASGSASARCSWRTRSSRCSVRWRRSRGACSPRTSCCGTSGGSARGAAPDSRLPREPAARKLDPEGRALRLQLLGCRLPADRGRDDLRRHNGLNRAMHELRRPLAGAAAPRRRRRATARLASAARRGGLLGLATSALADLDGAVNGGAARPTRRLSCRELVLACLERWRPQRPRRGASASTGTPGPRSRATPLGCPQALDNLISNALEHGGPPLVVTGALVAGRIDPRSPTGRSAAPRAADPRRAPTRPDLVSDVASAHRGASPSAAPAAGASRRSSCRWRSRVTPGRREPPAPARSPSWSRRWSAPCSPPPSQAATAPDSRRSRASATGGGGGLEALAAGEPIGVELAQSALAVRRVPASFVPPGALARTADALGRAPGTTIPAGSYVLGAQLVLPRPKEPPEPGVGLGLRPVQVAVAGAEALTVDGIAPEGRRVDVVVSRQAGLAARPRSYRRQRREAGAGGPRRDRVSRGPRRSRSASSRRFHDRRTERRPRDPPAAATLIRAGISASWASRIAFPEGSRNAESIPYGRSRGPR